MEPTWRTPSPSRSRAPGRPSRRRRLGTGILLAAAVFACGLAACGSPSGSATATTPTPASGSGTTTTSSAPTTVAPSTSTAPRTVSARGLPGEAYDHGPAAGQVLAVVGVAAGSHLTLRDLPSAGGSALTTLGPTASRVIATGRARLVEPEGTLASSGTRPTVWAEVTVAGTTGWADASQLSSPAATTDLTAEVVDRLGRRPVAETMLDLGTAVAQVYVSSEPPSTVVVSVAPRVGDLGEITMDVVGLGDDSVAAQRLHIFGTPGDESFTLKAVEGTAFCSRGVSAGGLCL